MGSVQLSWQIFVSDGNPQGVFNVRLIKARLATRMDFRSPMRSHFQSARFRRAG